jgi:hypothetical protein
MTPGDGKAPSPAVLPQKDGAVSVLPSDGRRFDVPSRPDEFRTDGTVENTAGHNLDGLVEFNLDVLAGYDPDGLALGWLDTIWTD